MTMLCKIGCVALAILSLVGGLALLAGLSYSVGSFVDTSSAGTRIASGFVTILVAAVVGTFVFAISEALIQKLCK